MDEMEEEMTGKEIRRFVEMQAEEGKTPLETIAALLKLVGVDEVPAFKRPDTNGTQRA